MRSILVFVALSALLFSCGTGTDKGNKKSKEAETHTDPPALDTFKQEKKLSLYNDKYLLKINRYSLNDGGICIDVGEDDNRVYRQCVHNYAISIELVKEGKPFLKRNLIKEEFKDSLDAGFLNQAHLWNVRYMFVRAQRLIFAADLLDPHTKKSRTQWFALFWDGEKKGQMQLWGVEHPAEEVKVE